VDVDGVLIESRMQRVWRASETGDVGTTTLIFDVSNLGPIVPTDLRLLIDRDYDGFFDNDVAPMTGVFAGNFITFSGVNLQDADFFTLGSINASQTPLPIELLSFNAIENDITSVNCFWSTASETNNDFFLVERSRDGINFSEVGRVVGAGTSNATINYALNDYQPYSGLSYYRLKQVDFNGEYSYSNIVSIQRDISKEGEIIIMPNPNSGKFHVRISNQYCGQSSISIADMNGRVCHHQSVDFEASNAVLIPFDLTLSPGKYALRVECLSGAFFSEEFIIK